MVAFCWFQIPCLNSLHNDRFWEILNFGFAYLFALGDLNNVCKLFNTTSPWVLIKLIRIAPNSGKSLLFLFAYDRNTSWNVVTAFSVTSFSHCASVFPVAGLCEDCNRHFQPNRWNHSWWIVFSHFIFKQESTMKFIFNRHFHC